MVCNLLCECILASESFHNITVYFSVLISSFLRQTAAVLMVQQLAAPQGSSSLRFCSDSTGRSARSAISQGVLPSHGP
jgi:hypothetical protein